jgi:hypothetical protein
MSILQKNHAVCELLTNLLFINKYHAFDARTHALYQFLASPFSLRAKALSRMRKAHGYKVNQTHEMSLRGGGLGHWFPEHLQLRVIHRF